MSRTAGVVIVGGGVTGTSIAFHLAGLGVRDILLLERDALPSAPVARSGTPQARQVHVLLRGGLDALSELLPDFETELERAGPFACGSALNFASNYQALIRFRGAISGSTVSV